MKPTGGSPQPVPISPPAPLFGNVSSAFNRTDLGKTGASTLQGILSGQNLGQLFKSIQDANQYQSNIDIAGIKETYGSSGMGMSTDLAKGITQYRLQNQAQMNSLFGQLGLQNESLQLGGVETLMQLATSFAPTEALTQAPAGPSMFSQIASAGESAMMLYLLAGAACWIAASIYGESDLRTDILRAWLYFEAPTWFRWFYLKYGQFIAKTPFRWAFYPLFEFVLWRRSCQSIQGLQG